MNSGTDYFVLWRRGMWIAWLRGVGVPTPHISALLEIPSADVCSCKVSRSPLRRIKYRLNLTPSRRITNDTARRVRGLHGLDYAAEDIARILVLSVASVQDYLTRVAGSRVESRRRPRTAREQETLERNRLRREEARAAADDGAGWRRSWSHQDDGDCESPLPPPAAKVDQVEELPLVDQVDDVVEAPPVARWEGPWSPQATKKRKPPLPCPDA